MDILLNPPLSEFSLAVVERKEGGCLEFQCDSYMQEVDSPLSFVYCMFFAELVRTSKNVSPFDRRVNQNTIAEVLVELLKGETKLR